MSPKFEVRNPNVYYLNLDNDQLDAHLLYLTIRPLESSICFKQYMIIIRRLNCIDAVSGIVRSASGGLVHRCTRAPDGHWRSGRYQMLHQYNSVS